MTGLWAVFERSGRPVQETTIDAGLSHLVHRPVDRSGTLVEGPIGLGAREWWTVPGAEHAPQPRISSCGRFVALLDGRIDYLDEVAAQVGRPKTTADIDILLAAFSRWGNAAFDRLCGEFAALIWDRANHRLTVAREGFAGPPLYWAWERGTRFVAGSELQQVVHGLEHEPPINEGVVGELLCGAMSHPTETLRSGIERLPAHHLLEVDENGVHGPRRFWGPEPQPILRLGSDAEYAERWREVVGGSVRNACRARGPIGVDVSGGLDSSSIAALACQFVPRSQLRGLTQTFAPGSRTDERQYWEAVYEHLGIEAFLENGDAPDTSWFRCRITASGNLGVSPDGETLVRLCTRLQSAGGRVELNGMGGDELWWPPTTYIANRLLSGDVRGAAEDLRSLVKRDRPVDSTFRALKSSLAVPMAVEHGPRWIVRKRGIPPVIPPYVQPAFAARIMLAQRIMTPRAAFSRRPAAAEMGRMLTDAAKAWYSALFHTELAALGVERRQPFGDRRVVAFALSLPDAQRGRGLTVRLAHRNAMKGLLPESVRLRESKAEFSSVFEAAIVAWPGERAIADYVVDAAFEQDIREVLRGGARSAQLTRVWQTLMLSWWLSVTRVARTASDECIISQI